MSVAIRAITRVQDADDFGSTPGAGNDGYVWTWNYATLKFVLTASAGGGVTAHGALTGLANDDHTGYLLATGARTGASAAAQTFTNGIIGPSWKPAADSTTALQLQNAAGTSIVTVDTTNGRVGIGITPTVTLHIVKSSSNATTYPGLYVQNSNASDPGGTGYNFSVASFVAGNGAVISQFGANFGTGAAPPFSESGFMVTTRTNHPIIFWTGATTTEKMRITNAGLVGIGTTAPATALHVLLTSAATNAVTNVLTIGHDTSGTAAAGFGAGQLFALESSTTAAQSAARIQALWYEATHATRKADLVGTAYDAAGEREGWRVRGNGSAAAIGFLGATPAARIAHVADPSGGGTVDAEARTAINSILATLETFGFHSTS